ncbi:hypothetical protein MKW92_015264 [Papaver armeniacum]|nr:hypothetical protein MKW92_015264 [Papaver armeniacum]
MSQPLKFSTDTVLLALLVVSSYSLVLSAISSTGAKQHLQVVGVEQEVDALLKWKSSVVSQTHSLLPSWKINSTRSTTTSPCKWYGITCNNEGSVLELNISGLGLEGTLNNFNFSSFSNFVSLNLSDNKLFGTIPPQISILPKLTHLFLYMNKFSGRIPQEIGSLTSLQGFLKIKLVDQFRVKLAICILLLVYGCTQTILLVRSLLLYAILLT